MKKTMEESTGEDNNEDGDRGQLNNTEGLTSHLDAN